MTFLSEVEKAEIRLLHAQGKTPLTISRLVGRARTTVRNYIKTIPPTTLEEAERYENLLLKQIEKFARAGSVKPVKYKPVVGGNLLEVAPFDLHILKYCWGPETVTDYSVDAAVHLFKQAIEDLIEKSKGFPIERVLLVVGNDVLHVNGPENTTAAGTPMDVDTRFFRGFIKAHEVHSWAIRRLLEVAPVDVVVVRGNHDNAAAWHLGHVLATEFIAHPNVAVDNGPRYRKYYKYGVNLLGFTHGDSERIEDLPLIMAKEMPQEWAGSEQREWHIGHKHKLKETHFTAGDAFAGVRVRILSSLSAHDAWHTKHGYMDRRACEAFIHNSTTGYVGHLSANVGHFTGELLK